MAPNPIWLVSLYRGKIWIQTCTLGDHNVKRKAESWAKECQNFSANHQKPGKRHGSDCPSQPLEGTNLTDTLILPPDNKFLLFTATQCVGFHYSNPSRWIQLQTISKSLYLSYSPGSAPTAVSLLKLMRPHQEWDVSKTYSKCFWKFAGGWLSPCLGCKHRIVYWLHLLIRL